MGPVSARNIHGIETPPNTALRSGAVEGEALTRFSQILEAGDSGQPEAEPDEDDVGTEGAGEEEEGGGQAGEEQPGEEELEEPGGEPDQAKEVDLPEKYLASHISLKDGSRVTVDEAIKGYMKDADYRQKTTQTKELYRAVEAMRQQVEAKAQETANQMQQSEHVFWLANTIEANPWMDEALIKFFQGDLQGADEIRSGNVMHQVQPPQQQFRDPRVDEILLQNEMGRLSGEWEKIVASDPKADFSLVQQTAQQYGFKHLDDAYAKAYEEKIRERLERQGYEKAVREIKKGAEAPTSMKGGKPGAKFKGQPKKITDPVEAAAAMYKKL